MEEEGLELDTRMGRVRWMERRREQRLTPKTKLFLLYPTKR